MSWNNISNNSDKIAIITNIPLPYIILVARIIVLQHIETVIVIVIV